ncbi:YidB family protein [Brucella sp. BE17]|uniref:YidB family protein n=1 Tax=Brucella sp. BE17 TaxID=3142977 RepID=UPI0031BB2435
MSNDADNSNSPIPGGNLAKPVMIALGALLVGKLLSGHKDDPEQAAQPAQPQADNSLGGGLGGGLLGSVLGGLGGLLGGAAAGNAANAPAAPGPLSGGLGGLLEQLRQSGLGDKVESWVGQGENAPIEPGHLGEALGQKTINELAQHAGIDPQELLGQLSQVLPGLVDKLTAGGQVPDTSELSKLLNKP